MRVSVTSWRTTEDDIDRSAAAILACLATVDQGQRRIAEDPGRLGSDGVFGREPARSSRLAVGQDSGLVDIPVWR